MKLFAFWKYDLFPYVLGGEFTNVNDAGYVYVLSYQGWFNPIKILPIDKGYRVLKELENLRSEHRAACKNLDAKFIRRAKDILPEINKGK